MSEYEIIDTNAGNIGDCGICRYISSKNEDINSLLLTRAVIIVILDYNFLGKSAFLILRFKKLRCQSCESETQNTDF